MTPLDLVVSKLTAAGCNPRRSATRADQYTAKCPNSAGHQRGDKRPSLSVGVGADGRALVHCETGCEPDDVVRALGLSIIDLFPDKADDGPARPRVAAAYDYHDADGTLVFQVVRMDPKGFRQRRPLPSGQWAWDLNGVDERPLYRLPHVLDAVRRGEPIWVCEGEKDVEALVVAGHVATCNPAGAGKWRPEHTAALYGARLVEIVADDDAAGHDHAQAVAAALASVADEVRTWLPHRGCKDVAEHLGQGRALAELRPMCDVGDDGPGVELEPPDELLSLLIDWDEFWKEDHKAEEWIAWPLIPAGRQTALYAPAKTGKSIVTLAVVAALAAGWPILGQPASPPVHVLYLDYEMTRADLHERLEALGYDADVDLSHLHYASLPSLPPLNTEAGAQAVTRLALAVGARVVIVDTTGRAVDGDENDAGPYRDFARWTGLSLKSKGIALLRTDHAGKDKTKGQRGSSAKNDDVDVVFRLDVIEGGYNLERTHSRVGWVPDKLQIVKTDENGIVEFRAERKARTYIAGTAELVAILDHYGVDVGWGRRKVGEWLRSQGRRHASKAIDDAIAYRQEQARHTSRHTSDDEPGHTSRHIVLD